MIVTQGKVGDLKYTNNEQISSSKFYFSKLYITLGTICVLVLTVLALSIALGVISNRRKSDIVHVYTNIEPNKTIPSLVDSINIDQLLTHLKNLQQIAQSSNGTRMIHLQGFNSTVDYIYSHLTQRTNLVNIQKQHFYVNNFMVDGTPILTAFVDGKQLNFTYYSNFTHMIYTGQATNWTLLGYSLSIIPNLGCVDNDWLDARDRVALVRRGNCTFTEKIRLATKVGVKGFLLYNDGLPSAPSNREILNNTRASEGTTFPTLFLSYQAGQTLLINPQNTTVFITIKLKDVPPSAVTNICADTHSGDKTQTIVIGSHSDSVQAGNGINDNGSGTAANLVLATNLDKLFQMSTYRPYAYRVRFCWWGGEEFGLLGSKDHVMKAKNNSIVGERLQDYLVNLNFDMLGSPNFIFGIYNGASANNMTTPARAIPGSIKLTEIFRDYFNRKQYPWDLTKFDGRSDYGPFLAEGIACSGLTTGADGVKTQEQRDRYATMLGQQKIGLGMPNVIYDPCYHKVCDTVQNIHLFAYETIVQAAAYTIEYLGRLNDLKAYLYPS
ncbi:unnamed protein product [Didymodactylos carnosus]|uniref:Peptide hydrolase n=1 Tax=Didymodactylos carnosus TaxID=1234261 RepID=A0A813XSL4_9BILA|nr:unnamed protein product [Didymodactylos carnosus]CAF0869235.1 unnamed protein product [Didymodactylos carnosus]CAF3528163.1 unnamed protein product [Didymodactylos carnosus]CAF3656667.1 unnamed protein product [Didymodactylos carnosus]